MTELRKIAVFNLKDGKNNKSKLTVFVNEHDEIHYSLMGKVSQAMSNLGNHLDFPEFYEGDDETTVDKVEEAISFSYRQTVSVITPEKKEKKLYVIHGNIEDSEPAKVILDIDKCVAEIFKTAKVLDEEVLSHEYKTINKVKAKKLLEEGYFIYIGTTKDTLYHKAEHVNLK